MNRLRLFVLPSYLEAVRRNAMNAIWARYARGDFNLTSSPTDKLLLLFTHTERGDGACGLSDATNETRNVYKPSSSGFQIVAASTAKIIVSSHVVLGDASKLS
jgi:hypothetical protein